MGLEKDQEITIGLTLSSFLIAVAVAFLSLMALQDVGASNSHNELFGVIGLFSLLTSALIIDSILDHANFNFLRRIRFLNGGYTLFCLLVAGINAGIIYFYRFQEGIQLFTPSSPITTISMIFTLAFTFLKLMTKDDKHTFAPALLLTYSLAFFGKDQFFTLSNGGLLVMSILFFPVLLIIDKIASDV
ncbi:MAG: hypothetical protein AAF572_03320 [Cyanobacteria bacterium P01_B01_bin.77]